MRCCMLDGAFIDDGALVRARNHRDSPSLSLWTCNVAKAEKAQLSTLNGVQHCTSYKPKRDKLPGSPFTRKSHASHHRPGRTPIILVDNSAPIDDLDIAGETPWVRKMIDAHKGHCVATGAGASGFLTSTSRLGDVLVKRLRAAGTTLAVDAAANQWLTPPAIQDRKTPCK